jgi:hypothetical protein
VFAVALAGLLEPYVKIALTLAEVDEVAVPLPSPLIFLIEYMPVLNPLKRKPIASLLALSVNLREDRTNFKSV